jgi:hypothetical protein
MERYYEILDKEYQDMDLIIESIFYENALKYAFDIAMEDPIVATSSPSDGDTKQASDNKQQPAAAAKIEAATNNAGKVEDNAKKNDEEKTKTQGEGNDNPKIKQELTNNIRQITEKIRQFIREYIAKMNNTMSTMLKDGANTEAELSRLKANGKLNTNIVYADFHYNDKFLTEFETAVVDAVRDYNEQYTRNMNLINEARNAASNGDTEKAKEYFSNSNNKAIQETDNATGETATATKVEFTSAVVLVAKRLNLTEEKIGEINITNIKKYAYKVFKGYDPKSEEEVKPTKFTLKDEMYYLTDAERFIKSYRTNLKSVNTINDSLKRIATAYEDMCKNLEPFNSVDEQLNASFNRILNRCASDINELVALNTFAITALRERATSCEILIRMAYSGKRELTAEKDRAKNPPKNQTNNAGGNEQ